MKEFEVIVKREFGGCITAYVYAKDESGAKRQARAQGFDLHRIKDVKYYGEPKQGGRI